MKKGQLPSIRISEEAEQNVRAAAATKNKSVSTWMREVLEAAAKKVLGMK